MGRFERGLAKLDDDGEPESIEDYIRRRFTVALNQRFDDMRIPRPDWCPLCGDHHVTDETWADCPMRLDELLAMDGLT